MESKKFVNLPSGYKDFLSNCEKLTRLAQIDGKTQLTELGELYTQVSKYLEQNNLQISDINHLITNYSKPNDQVDQLKKLVYYRNYYIITNCIRSNQWKELIKNIKLKNPDSKIKTKDIENATLKLLEKYIGSWDTIEKIIVIDKKYSIKSIEIVDPDDWEFKCFYNNEESYSITKDLFKSKIVGNIFTYSTPL